MEEQQLNLTNNFLFSIVNWQIFNKETTAYCCKRIPYYIQNLLQVVQCVPITNIKI